MEHKLSLVEALLGFEFAFRHLDDHVVVVKSVAEHVTSSGELVTVEGEGMPLPKRSNEKGDLYIKFSIQMPTTAELGTLESKTQLRSLFPKVSALPLIQEKEEYTAKSFDEAAQQAKHERDQQYRRSATEDDEDDERPSCRTQ